jgi:WD40 repeat protein
MITDFGKVTLWNIADARLAATFEYGGYVLTLLQLPERRVAFGGSDRTIRVCDQRTLREDVQITGHGGAVSALAVLDDGRLVSGAWDRCMCIWNLATGEYEPMYGHTDAVWAILPLSNRVILSGSRDRTIRIWTRDSTWTNTVAFMANGGITSLVFSGDRSHVVVGDATGRLPYFALRAAAVDDVALTGTGAT